MSGPTPVVDDTSGEVLYVGSTECPRCEAQGRRAEAIMGDVGRLERELRNAGRKITRLENELQAQREQAPERPRVVTLFRRWVEKTDRNPKTTKLGTKREEAVLKMVRQYDDDFLVRAIDGGSAFASTSSAETQRVALIAALAHATDTLDGETAQAVRKVYREAMKDVTVYDDLELICRDEVKIERFHQLAGRLPEYAG